MAEVNVALDKLLSLQQINLAAIRARQNEAPPPPSIQSLCLEYTLYAGVQLNPERDAEFLYSLKFKEQQFDAHCVYCGKGSTFRTFPDRMPGDVAELQKFAVTNRPSKDALRRLKLEGGQFALHLLCARRPEHLYSYFFAYDETQGILTKLGQTPSLEDVAGADIERYRKILGPEFAELRRATGLFAHGIGIGSFVYLRRIFEALVEKARIASDPTGEREAELKAMRMSERIAELASFLPPAVIKYKDAYGILSKGLHELTEAECRRHFPVIRAAVIMMLEQQYEAAEKAKMTAELDRAVSAIATEAKGTNG